MKNKTYEELLQDPRWDACRRSILKAVGYYCQRCKAENIELHVHHKYYLKNIMPWDYPTDAYEVLCLNCHRREHANENSDFNHESGIRPVRSIRQVMIDFIQNLSKGVKKNG